MARFENLSVDTLTVNKILSNKNLVARGATSVGGTGLSSFWDDCPRIDMLVDPTLGHFVMDDFALTNGESFTTAKNYTLAGANGTFAKVASVPEGAAKLDAIATNNNECNVNLNSTVGLITTAGTPDWWYESRVKINQITAEQGVFVGLVGDQITLGVDFMTDDTMALKVQDVFGFQIIVPTAAASIWQAVHIKTGGARVAVTATAATASTGWVKLGMKCINGVLSYFVDGGKVGTNVAISSAANFPKDLYFVPAWAIKSGVTAGLQTDMQVDWWAAAQLR